MHSLSTKHPPRQSTLAGSLLLISVVALIFSPIARSPSVWVLLGIALYTLWHWRADLNAACRALWPIALPVVAALLLSLMFSKNPWHGATAFRDVIKAGVVALALALLVQNAHTQWLARGIASACIILGLGALVLINAPTLSATVTLLFDSIENMNLWGAAFALLLSAGLATAVGSRPRVAVLLIAVLAISFAWLSLYYLSRGALLAVLCVTIILVLLRFTRLPLSGVFALTAIAFLLGSLALIIIHAGGWMSDARINEISSGRLPIYDTTWQFWQQAPWFGWGLKAFKTHAALNIAGASGGHFTAPHNILLEMLYSVGLVGTALMLSVLGRIYWLSLVAARSSPQALLGLIATALLATLVFHGATDLSIYRPYFWLVVLSAWGLVQGTSKPH